MIKLSRILPSKLRESLYLPTTPIRYFIAMMSYYVKKEKFRKINFMQDIQTIDKIISERSSLCRFGDGELKWILKIEQITFQQNSEGLAKRLIEIITSTNDDFNVLIAVPNVFGSLNEFRYNSKKFWRLHTHSYRKDWVELLDGEKCYSNALITRYYTNYKNENNNELIFEDFKKVWLNRNVVIVEGRKSRMGIGNDLFINTKSIRRILAPATNAFSKYNDILEMTRKVANKDDVILIALGPTATVLAYDLAKDGYQAIDLGHLDIEYEWKNMKVKRKTPIKGKYVNEAMHIGDLSEVEIEDYEYKSSIITEI